jgi:hypothetical protein
MTKIRRSVEKPEGQGQIRLADGRSVPVRFALVVFRMVDDEADTGQQAGPLEVRGAIETDAGAGRLDLAGQHFTLRTPDGRCLEAVTKKGDPATRQWEIRAAGQDGLAPC